ncbi:hypothetical protein AZ78_3311 [Lysobacter capsici AZ78]|uniref:Uncharacterized protein n=1 Tax=Lysobacter capsici AZ78 TaxID=1444315 RepID=A0A108UAZ2_9GAMM|nr:hypothetical protein AZ78_3311 [Lysobacter capsici AZ78]
MSGHGGVGARTGQQPHGGGAQQGGKFHGRSLGGAVSEDPGRPGPAATDADDAIDAPTVTAR